MNIVKKLTEFFFNMQENLVGSTGATMSSEEIQRKRVNDDCAIEPTTKRLKSDVAESLPLDDPTTSITDLNDLCLHNIFKHLDVVDLVNVSNVMDQRLRNIASFVFQSKFGQSTFEFHAHTITLRAKNEVRIIASTITDKRGLLEHFGKIIITLRLEYDQVFRDQLEPVLFKQCSGTLETLWISGDQQNLFENISSPFEKVENVSLSSVRLDEHSMQLHKWFPNMRDLYLELSSIPNNFLHHHFMQLTKICILEIESVRAPDIIQLVALNPQLLELEFLPSDILTNSHNVKVDRQLLDTVADKLPNLELLAMSPLSVAMPGNTRDSLYTSGLFAAMLPDATVDDSKKPIPFTFDRMHTLHLTDCMTWNSEWTKFISRHVTLTSLTIACDHFNDLPVNIQEIAEHLPNLTELVVWGCTVTTEHIEWILSEHKSIDRLEIGKVFDGNNAKVPDIELFGDFLDDWIIEEFLAVNLIFEKKI